MKKQILALMACGAFLAPTCGFCMDKEEIEKEIRDNANFLHQVKEEVKNPEFAGFLSPTKRQLQDPSFAPKIEGLDFRKRDDNLISVTNDGWKLTDADLIDSEGKPKHPNLKRVRLPAAGEHDLSQNAINILKENGVTIQY